MYIIENPALEVFYSRNTITCNLLVNESFLMPGG